jgi:hypothetical protein
LSERDDWRSKQRDRDDGSHYKSPDHSESPFEIQRQRDTSCSAPEPF